MVGHTGQYEPAVKACTATDKAIGAIKEACRDMGVVLLVTADHGNAERMIDEEGKPVTKHTTFRGGCGHRGGVVSIMGVINLMCLSVVRDYLRVRS